MTNLVKFDFSGHSVRIEDRNGETWFVAKDVCEVLDIKNVSQAVSYLDEDERAIITNDTRNDNWETIIISESGLYSLILRSRKSEAKTFKRWITHEVLPTIRRTGYYGVDSSPPSQQITQLRERAEIAEMKLQVFEEHSPAKFYDYDEVASLMHHYMKPPFGRNHLKRWLIDRRILCARAFKNDKPIQTYLDRGWFVAVIHEWFRKGRKHSENRYHITPRGVMGIIDIAIRERLVTLPAARQACLPGLFDDDLPAEAGGSFMVHAAGPVPRRIREPEYAGPNKPR